MIDNMFCRIDKDVLQKSKLFLHELIYLLQKFTICWVYLSQQICKNRTAYAVLEP
jgi:hypothetical protein